MRPHLAVRKTTSYLMYTQEAEQEVGPDYRSSKPALSDLLPRKFPPHVYSITSQTAPPVGSQVFKYVSLQGVSQSNHNGKEVT